MPTPRVVTSRLHPIRRYLLPTPLASGPSLARTLGLCRSGPGSSPGPGRSTSAGEGQEPPVPRRPSARKSRPQDRLRAHGLPPPRRRLRPPSVCAATDAPQAPKCAIFRPKARAPAGTTLSFPLCTKPRITYYQNVLTVSKRRRPRRLLATPCLPACRRRLRRQICARL